MDTKPESKKQTLLKNLFGIDVRALAVSRVLISLVLIVDLINRARFLTDHYTDQGVLPRYANLSEDPNEWLVSFHMMTGSTLGITLLFIAAGAFAVQLLLGYKTRLATIASWLLLISLQNANPLVIQGGDVELRMLLFFAMFIPWGKAYSVDTALSYKQPKNEKIVSLATAGILLQVSYVYFFAAFLKTSEDWHTLGSSVYFALNLEQYTTPFTHLLLPFPLLMMALTFFVLWLQRLSFFFLFFPLKTDIVRGFAATLLIGMHISFAIFLEIGPFPYISIAGLLLFLPPRLWDAVFNFFKTDARKKLTLYYDGDCGFCKKSIHLARMFLLIPETRVLPAQNNPDVLADMQKNNSWVIEDSSNSRAYGYQGGVMILRHSPILSMFAPLFALKACVWFGEKVYRLVANHRSSTCELVMPMSKKKRTSFFLQLGTILRRAFLIGVIIYITVYNVTTLPSIDYHYNDRLMIPANLLRLDQMWGMFAPSPFKDSGWFVIPGKLRNGEVVDIFRDGEPVTTQKPDDVSETYISQRWRKYLMNLWLQEYSNYRLYYAQYLCREWNQNHTFDEQVTELKIFYLFERVLPPVPGKQRNVTPVISSEIWHHKCFWGY